MKKWGFLLLKMGVTIGLMAWLLRSFDWPQALAQLSRARPGYLLLTLAIIWFGHFLCVVRWKYLLAAFEIPMETVPLVLIYGIGMFFNLVLPGLVGGDLVKTYMAGRNSKRPYSLAFTSVFLDRDIGFLALFLIAVVGAMIDPLQVQGYSLLICFLGLLALCILANILLFSSGAHRLAVSMISSQRFSDVIRKIEMLSEALSKVRGKPHILAGALMLSLVNQFLVVISSWLIARSLDVDAPLHYFFVFIPATVVITMIPISINGVGLRELAYVSFFSSIGVSKEEGVLMGFLSSLIIIFSGLPGSVAYLLHKREVGAEQLAAYQSALAHEPKLP